MTYKKDSDNTKKYKTTQTIQDFWNDYVMERFIKANLFMICCVAAGLLLIVYLGAFSCEVSWILEAHGDLPFAAYILCTQYFVVFVATTILIHGLVTGLPWGLFAWSIIIGLLSIPELVFVMIMTTQHWGLQSVHGLVELISYLGRLVINCFALICVIPTGIRWRRETQVLNQLQDLATRLQLQTPPPSVPGSKGDSRRTSKRFSQSAFDNSAFQMGHDQMKLTPSNGNMPYFNQHHNNINNNTNNNHNNTNNNNLFGSQNEFNASLFSTNSYLPQYTNTNVSAMPRNSNRAHSLMDLRCTLPGMYNPRHVLENDDKNGKYFNITIDDLKNTLNGSIHKLPQSINPPAPPSVLSTSTNDPIYCSIEPIPTPDHMMHTWRDPTTARKLTRNCISLENLDGIAKVQQELNAAALFGHNFLQNYTQQQQQYYLALLAGQLNPLHNHVYRQTAGPLPGGYGNEASMMLPALGHQRHNSSQKQHLQYFNGFGYANFTNPYITAHSKLSLGNESDDYRKYRDVAL